MLVKDKLIHNIRSITDMKYSEFDGFPKSYEEAVLRWTFAFSNYYEDVHPFSTTIFNSKILFAAMMRSFEGKPLDLETIYEFTIEEVALGMVGWNAHKSIEKLNLKDIYQIGYDGGEAKDIAEKISDRIHVWMLKGTAIKLTAPYNLINWK